jgi:hypothetical protein
MQGISVTMMSMLPGTAILCSLTCVCVVAIQHARQLSINEHGKSGGAVPQRGQREHVPLGVLQHNLSQRYGLICVVPDQLPHLQALMQGAEHCKHLGLPVRHRLV